MKREELCTRIYGDYFSENQIVFSGNIPKKWLDTIVDTVEKEIVYGK